MILSPMLLPSQPLNTADLDFTVPQWYVQPKLDGVRITFRDGLPITRSKKRLPNLWIEHALTQTYANSPWAGLDLDGELLIWNTLTNWWDPFNTIQSVVMSKNVPALYIQQGWRYQIFTYDSNVSFHLRQQDLFRLGKSYMNRFNLLDSIIASKDTVEEAGRRLIDQYKYEGAVVWNPFGYYKHGRATYKEQLAFKFVDWARDEALVVDFQELQGNCDTSTTKLDNMMPMNMLGALVVESAKYGRFNIGTGFSNAQRIEIWNSREVYRNKLITFKYKPGHIKYVPCPAVFVGFRNPLDLSLS